MNEANSSPAAGSFRVLVLEPDEKLGAEIIAALHEAMPDATGAIAYSVEEAQRLVVNQKPELFVLDLDATNDRAQEFIYDLRTSHPDARAIILTSGHFPAQRERVSGLGAVHFLEKPFPKNDFMTLAEAMLTPAEKSEGERFQGRLSDLHIADIIQLKCISGATSLLEFTGPRGEKARVYFERGQVRHAETPGRQGRDAFEEIIDWKGGLITEVPVPENPRRTIDLDWQMLLMDAVRKSDENRGVKPEEAPAPAAAGRKILVIDDSLMLLSFVKEMLHEQSYAVASAATADEGLQEARRATPDLILLDYVLPDMKGDEVCRKLIADPVTSKIPVVYMSGLGSDLQANKQELPNVIGSLSKPFTSESLISALEKFLPEKKAAPSGPVKAVEEKTAMMPRPATGESAQPAEPPKVIRAIEPGAILAVENSLGAKGELKSAGELERQEATSAREPFSPAHARPIAEIPSGPIRAIEPPPAVPEKVEAKEPKPEKGEPEKASSPTEISEEPATDKLASTSPPKEAEPIAAEETPSPASSLGEEPPSTISSAEPSSVESSAAAEPAAVESAPAEPLPAESSPVETSTAEPSFAPSLASEKPGEEIEQIKTEMASPPPIAPGEIFASSLGESPAEATAEETAPPSSLYFCGDSSFFSLHWALQTIGREKLTGVLRAFWSHDSVEVLAREGRVILVTSRDPQLYCDENPVTLLNVDPQRIEAAREQQRQSGRPPFLTLAEEGLILREPATQLVQHYGQKLFARLWSEGRVRFVFEQRALPEFTRELSSAEQNIDQWALSTLRFVQYPELEKAPPIESGCVPAYTRDGVERVQELRLTDAEAQFASQFNGTRSIAQIAKNLRLDIKFARLTLFRFLALEIVECWPPQIAQKSESRGGLRSKIFGR